MKDALRKALDVVDIRDRLSQAGRDLGLSTADQKLLTKLHRRHGCRGLIEFATGLACVAYRPTEPCDPDESDAELKARLEPMAESMRLEMYRIYARLLLFIDMTPEKTLKFVER